MDHSIAAALAERCNVSPDVLTPISPSACPHLDDMLACVKEFPAELLHAAHQLALKEYRAEQTYRREILGLTGDSTPPPPPPALPTSSGNLLNRTPQCSLCKEETEFSHDDILLFPTVDLRCTHHARQEVWRDNTDGPLFSVTPRGLLSSLWCISCGRGVDWRAFSEKEGVKRQFYDVIQQFPVPKAVRESEVFDSLTTDPSMGDCLIFSNYVSEARRWCLGGKGSGGVTLTSPSPVRGLFLPLSGADVVGPDGVESEFSVSLYENTLTSYASLPHAGLRNVAIPAGKEGENSTREVSCISLCPPFPEDKVVSGYFLAIDEEEIDTSRIEALTAKITAICEHSEGVLTTRIRQVCLCDTNKWVDAAVVCLHPSQVDACTEDLAEEGFATFDSIKEYINDEVESVDSEASDEDEEDEEEESEEEDYSYDNPSTNPLFGMPGVPTAKERVDSWVQFFIDAYKIAKAIAHVGQMMRDEEEEEDGDANSSASSAEG